MQGREMTTHGYRSLRETAKVGVQTYRRGEQRGKEQRWGRRTGRESRSRARRGNPAFGGRDRERRAGQVGKPRASSSCAFNPLLRHCAVRGWALRPRLRPRHRWEQSYPRDRTLAWSLPRPYPPTRALGVLRSVVLSWSAFGVRRWRRRPQLPHPLPSSSSFRVRVRVQGSSPSPWKGAWGARAWAAARPRATVPLRCSRAECVAGINLGRLSRLPPLLPLLLVASFFISGRLLRCPPMEQKSPPQRSHHQLSPCVFCLFQ